ncbi:hypothetical protein [Succinimonas sp.]|uniref:hypothetical protein n=1 Tax=Succinimonas sp. TaxID=1936151 RepID=UPI00386B66D9
MAQATFSVHMDEVLKKQFDRLCQEFGMNASSESDVTREETMQAFLALREQAKKNGVADMTLDDINKEISLARIETGV